MHENFETEMNRGFLQLIMLYLLEVPMYGYDIVQKMERLGYTVEENSLYPLLRRLAAKEYLKSEWQVNENKPRKYYSVSEAGRDLRKEINKVWEKQNEILTKIKEGIEK